MVQHSYDLVVIGSGPAGQRAAFNAAKLGRSVAVIDRVESIGGGSIHNGTIPSKAMREAVLHLVGHGECFACGDSHSPKPRIPMSDLLYRTQHVVRSEVEVIRNQMNRNGITIIPGQASFVDDHTLRIAQESENVLARGAFILIACGTEPTRPADVPFTWGCIVDSTELLELEELPRSMIVVGGGVIGAEYSCLLAACGVSVTLVEARSRLLEFLDDELAENLQFRMRDMGVRLRLGESVAKIELLGDPASTTAPCDVIATLASQKRLRADTLLYAIGRRGATQPLNLSAAHLEADARGRLKVNEFYQTQTPHIYAAGDVIGFPALAATSMEQGRQASNHMFRQFNAAEPANPFVPYGIYTIPEISMVGQTEQSLTAAGTPYEAGIARYRDIVRGQLLADPQGLLKLLFDPRSRRLLGVHAIGAGATELIHIAQAVLTANLPIDYFVETVFNYPTLAECYKVAAMDGISRVRFLERTNQELPSAQAKVA